MTPEKSNGFVIDWFSERICDIEIVGLVSVSGISKNRCEILSGMSLGNVASPFSPLFSGFWKLSFLRNSSSVTWFSDAFSYNVSATSSKIKEQQTFVGLEQVPHGGA